MPNKQRHAYVLLPWFIRPLPGSFRFSNPFMDLAPASSRADETRIHIYHFIHRRFDILVMIVRSEREWASGLQKNKEIDYIEIARVIWFVYRPEWGR